MEPTLYTIKAIFILDNEGKRIISKYYDNQAFPSNKSRLGFETRLFSKTSKIPSAEIILFEGYTCVYRNNVDLFFYVIGDAYENELLLANALQCLYDSVHQILKHNVEKKQLLDCLDLVLLALDELCDGGILMENDSTSLTSRVGVKQEETPLGEQTVAQVIKSAREQLKLSNLLRG